MLRLRRLTTESLRYLWLLEYLESSKAEVISIIKTNRRLSRRARLRDIACSPGGVNDMRERAGRRKMEDE